MALRQEWYTAGDDEDQIVDDGTAGSTIEIAQTFTLGASGDNFSFTPSLIWLKISKAGSFSGSTTLSIKEIDPAGAPTGATIATATLNESSLTTTPTWKSFTLTATKDLDASRQYAIHLDISGFSSFAGADQIKLRADGTSPTYTGGSTWTTDGTTWTEDATTDLMFQIEGGAFTGTLCTLSEAINKAGVDVNSVAKNEILVNDFVKQAEAEINIKTRIDWVTEYSGLDVKVQKILNKTCASIAAQEMINYDTSTIGSLNAIRKLRLLDFQAQSGIEFLNEYKQKIFAGVSS